MGDRYILTMICEKCGYIDEAYFAPTCGFTTWTCKCGNKVNLCKHTGITKKMASNKHIIQQMIREICDEND